MIAFTRGVPAMEALPVDQIRECAQDAIRKHWNTILQYGQSSGFGLLRERMAAEYNLQPEQVLLSQGALQILDFIASTFIGPGGIALVERPSYDRAITVLRRAGAQVLTVPMEEDGLNVKALEQLVQVRRPQLVYLITDFQNPTGSTLSAEKRQKVAEIALRHQLLIVEDVPYRKLRYGGTELATLQSLIPERTLQLTSFSKLLSPGLRVGAVFGPRELIDPLAKRAEETYITPALLSQATVFEYLERDWLPAQIERLHALYRPRMEAMLAALAQNMDGLAGWVKPEGGFFVGLTAEKDLRAAEFLRRSKEAGLTLTDGCGFFADGGGDRFIRLPFCALTPEEIHAGIAVLARLIKEWE
jgi:2-aminoadipate transaminase